MKTTMILATVASIAITSAMATPVLFKKGEVANPILTAVIHTPNKKEIKLDQATIYASYDQQACNSLKVINFIPEGEAFLDDGIQQVDSKALQEFLGKGATCLKEDFAIGPKTYSTGVIALYSDHGQYVKALPNQVTIKVQ